MMSEWRETTLGDVIELKRGYDLPLAERRTGSVPIISSSGRSGFHDEAKVTGPGVVTGRSGTLGNVYYVGEDFWPLNTSLYVRDFKGNNPRFVSYWLLTVPLATLDGGAANPTLNRNHAHLLPVRIPTVSLQVRIAAILSAIDDLIENNERRIALLEQMAQAIYREWFVYFRYPGHEDDEFVDSPLGPIPDGWRVVPFSELANYLNGFAFKPAHWGTTGLPIVKIRELKQGVTPSTPRYDGSDIPARYRIDTGDLLFSWSAHLDAYLWPWEPALLNQHLFKVSPTDGVAKSWLFFALREEIDEFRSRSQGTTMKHIKRAALGEVSAVTPTARVMERFSVAVNPILDQLLALSRLLGPLEAIRDSLLPKLVTGAIDVSKLDLDGLLEEPAA